MGMVICLILLHGIRKRDGLCVQVLSLHVSRRRSPE